MKYYLHDGDERRGPFSLAQLKTKSITKDTPIWREGLEDWTKAGMLDELSSLFTSVPPPLKKNTLPTKSNFQNKRLAFVILVIVIMLAWMTNPNVEQHRAEAGVKLNENIEELKSEIKPKKKFWKVLKEVTFALSSGLLQDQINQRVWSEDYYLCSLTKIKLKNRDVTIGFGAFGNVWLFTDSISTISPEDF